MAFDRWLVKRIGFSLVSLQYSLAGRLPYTPTFLVTTVGSKSAELREAALPYLQFGDSWLVVGSRGGGPIDPNWVGNMRRHPQCWVTLRRRQIPVTAKIVSPQEWPKMYKFVLEHKPNVAHYQARADTFDRKIPFVLLTPRPKNIS